MVEFVLLLLKTKYHQLKKEGFVCTGLHYTDVMVILLFCCSAVVDLISTEVMFT